jgi:hypothetical protein
LGVKEKGLPAKGASLRLTVVLYFDHDLLKYKRRVFNEPGNVAIDRCRLLRGNCLHKLDSDFHLKRSGFVRTAMDLTKAEIATDPKLKQRVEKRKAVLTHRQP